MVDSAAYEFANTAKYLTTAEEIAGDYVWFVAHICSPSEIGDLLVFGSIICLCQFPERRSALGQQP